MKVNSAQPDSSRSSGPGFLLALCFLGLVSFLIAVTIVLSLIPIFLPTKNASLSDLNRQSNLFYLQYSATAVDGSAGFASNLADVSRQLNSALRLPSNTINIEQVEVQQATSSGRRRRLSSNENQAHYDVLLSCLATYPSSCDSISRRTAFFSFTRQRCLDTTILSLQLEINSRFIEFILQFLIFTLEAPSEFSSLDNFAIGTALSSTTTPTETTTTEILNIISTTTETTTTEISNIIPMRSIIIIAAQDGLFSSPSTWLCEYAPINGSYVIIPENITVSIDASILNISIAQIQIGGTLQIGFGHPGPFKFSNSFNIVILPNGRLIDATTGSIHGFSLALNTAILCYLGGQYIGKSTPALITAHDSNGNIVSRDPPVSLSDIVNGSWSLLVNTTGDIIFRPEIVLLAVQSGDFNDEETWCGRLIPVQSMSSLNGGSVLMIPFNITLAITDIDAQLSLPITQWIINGTLNLGVPDLPTGFYFSTSCNVSVQSGGALVALSTYSKSGIFFPQNSQLVIHPNGTLKGQHSSFLYLYQLGDINHIIQQTQLNSTEFFSTTEQLQFTFTSNSIITATTAVGCHLCATSSYNFSCNSCTFTPDGCTISCACRKVNGTLENTSITISPGTGNGCKLSNQNGVLQCDSFCS